MDFVCSFLITRIFFCKKLTSSQRILRIVRHRVGLVQNDQLEAAAEDRARRRKVQDLAAHDVDAAIVGRIQLQHHRAELNGRVQLAGAGQNRAGFASARWPVEQQMRQLVLVDEFVDCKMVNVEGIRSW